MTRKEMISQLTAGALGAGISSILPSLQSMTSIKNINDPLDLNGNINHSVCRWTFGQLSLDKLCRAVKDIGFSAIDLVGPDEWDVLKEHGIDSSMCNGGWKSVSKKGGAKPIITPRSSTATRSTLILWRMPVTKI